MRLFRHADARGDGFEDAVRLALKAVLVSPNFLYLVERDRSEVDGPYRVSDHELACRLSYFLWSSMPDRELSDLADAGRLHEPEVLEGQVRRMLADPKSRALRRGLRRPVAPRRQPGRARRARQAALPRVHARAPRRDGRGGRRLLPRDLPRGPARPGAARLRLHLPQRAAGEALRHRRRDRPGVPPGRAEGSQPRRRARHGGGADPDLVPEADQPGAPRQVGARGVAGHAPAAPAADGQGAAGRRPGPRRHDLPPAPGTAPQGRQLRLLPRPARPARLRARELRRARPLAGRDQGRAGRRLGRADHRRDVRRPGGLEDDPRRVQARAVRPQPRRADALLRPAEGRGILRYRRRSSRSWRSWRRTTTGGRP